MKKLLLLTLVMIMTLVACGKKKAVSEVTELTEPNPSDLANMDYVVTSYAADSDFLTHFVDGLLENDRYGRLVPAVAESYSHNEDSTVWTFKIRDGVKWVTNTGEEYANVTAHDFVTGIRHGVEFNSTSSWLLQGVVKGYAEYQTNAKFTDEEWKKVGVKALDDKTLEITLENPTSYFDSMATYSILYPINKEFLESKGSGCKLGQPDKKNCKFGAVEVDSILYNGEFLLNEVNAKSSTVMVKNENYWDADNVKINKVTRVYVDGKDPYGTIKGFEQGIYSAAGLNPSWKDFNDYLKKYEGHVLTQIPNSSVFGLVFNFNRKIYENTNHKSEESKAAAREAVLNDNFRKALRAAFDVQKSLEVSAPPEVAKDTLRNVNNFPEAGHADGKDYIQLVTDAYNQATGENVDLSDGQTPWLGKEKALKFIEAAKSEGIKFPVHLDMLVVETSDRLVKLAQSTKKSIEENTDGQIVVELVLRSQDIVEKIAYRNEDPAQSDYDISTFTGWGPDYLDPKSFVDIYSPVTGHYMKTLGLTNGPIDSAPDKAIKEKVGLVEYEKLYRAADAITGDLSARYKAFAKADAYLVQRAFYLPTQQRVRQVYITKSKPFTGPSSPVGIAGSKYKGLEVGKELTTIEEFNKAYEDYKANKNKPLN